MEYLPLLFRLIMAHLIGDFLLQPTAWIKHRQKHKERSPFLLAHALIHGILSFIFLWDFSLWYYAVIIAVSHYFIDILKSYAVKNKAQWFLIDQGLHFIFIGILWVFMADIYVKGMLASIAFPISFWLILVSVVGLTSPTGIFIGLATEKWRLEIKEDKKETLKDAGKWIGILERLMIFVFILLNRYEAVGFLLAAKSIFRFGDLREPKEKNQTEYLIIGTLLSFGIAIFTAIFVRMLIKELS